ncbi:MAG: helix-turn-helix domain-containing protein [Oligoflexales bacterium]|nr:helix-turn-helix domain-containing protein [Oligoflexales bacterium]
MINREIISDFLSIKEVAVYLRFHEITIYRLIKDKKIEAFKVAGNWRVKKECLDEYLKNRSNLSPIPPADSYSVPTSV